MNRIQSEHSDLIKKMEDEHNDEVDLMNKEKARREREHIKTMKTARDKFD